MSQPRLRLLPALFALVGLAFTAFGLSAASAVDQSVSEAGTVPISAKALVDHSCDDEEWGASGMSGVG